MADNNNALMTLIEDECGNGFLMPIMQEGTLFFELADLNTIFRNVNDLRKIIVKEEEYLCAYIQNNGNENVVELSYDIYSKMILDDAGIRGIVINPKSNHYVLRAGAIRYFEICQLVEEAESGEELQDVYYTCLLDVRSLWMHYKIAEQIEYLKTLLSSRIFKDNNGELYYYTAVGFEMLGDISQAEHFYRNAVKAEENNYWLYYQLGQFYKRIGNAKEELRVYKIAHKYYVYQYVRDSNDIDVDDGISYIFDALINRSYLDGKRSAYKRYKKEWDALSMKYRHAEPIKIYDMIHLPQKNEAENAEGKGRTKI